MDVPLSCLTRTALGKFQYCGKTTNQLATNWARGTPIKGLVLSFVLKHRHQRSPLRGQFCESYFEAFCDHCDDKRASPARQRCGDTATTSANATNTPLVPNSSIVTSVLPFTRFTVWRCFVLPTWTRLRRSYDRLPLPTRCCSRSL